MSKGSGPGELSRGISSGAWRSPARWRRATTWGLAGAGLATLAVAAMITAPLLGEVTPLSRRVETPPTADLAVEGLPAGQRPNEASERSSAAPSRDSLRASAASGGAAPAPAPAQAAPGTQGATGGAGGAGGAGLQPLPPLPASDRMIVKSGTVTLQVADLAEGMRRVGEVVNSVPGAYVAASTTSYRGDPAPPRTPVGPAPGGQAASLTLKVPAGDFGPVMERLRGLGTPLQEQVSTQEVTEEFVDLEAQVRSLETVEAQYLRLLERAQRVEEILPLQQRVTEVRTQIDRLRGRMNLLQRRADLSTIAVSLVLPARAGDPFAGPELRPLRTLRFALGGLGAALQGLLDATIYLAVYLLPLLPLVGLAYWWRRARRPAPPATAGG